MDQKRPLNRPRYQRGTVERIKTSSGLCYYLKYFERYADGSKKRVRVRVGLVSEFRSKSDLEKALEPLRSGINRPSVSIEKPKTMNDVIDRYRKEEMPTRHATRRGYDRMLRNHIEPRWGSLPLGEITAADARAWLRSLPMAPKTRGHIHGLMRVLFRFAKLCRWFDGENPMRAFRMEGASERTREPQVLTRDELHALVEKIKDPAIRRMVLIAAATGLRRSELAGLKWADIDWMGAKINVRRGVVEGRVGPAKTRASQKAIPLDPMVAEIFTAIRKDSSFQDDTDWVFASPRRNGKKPLDLNEIQASYIRKAGREAGLGDHLGWHTFRHSYKTWLDESDVPLTVQRDLMRHADIHTTAQVYGGVRVDRLRKANEGVVQKILTQ